MIVEPKSKREVTLRLANKESSYSFDRVFGPEITQQEIYDEVAQPILDEMLLGYGALTIHSFLVSDIKASITTDTIALYSLMDKLALEKRKNLVMMPL